MTRNITHPPARRSSPGKQPLRQGEERFHGLGLDCSRIVRSRDPKRGIKSGAVQQARR